LAVYGDFDKKLINERNCDVERKNILCVLPPRVTARIIAFIIAALISLTGARVMQNFIGLGEVNESGDQGGGGKEDLPANAGSEEKEEENVGHFDISKMAAVGTVISGKGAALFTLEDRKLIAGKGINEAIPVNDAAAFMTALIISNAVNEGRVSLTDEAVCPASAAKSDGYTLSAQILPIGKRMKVGDILKCMFYQSGSSYAYTLAVHISGSEEAFVSEMNEHAKALKLKDTFFTNCTGDKDEMGYTSPYDLAVIIKEVLSVPLLRDIICSDDMITVGYGQSESIALVVKNDFFERWCTPSQAKSDGIIGGKMGIDGFYSWSCVIFVKDSKTYVSLVLESKDAFADALMLYSAYAG
jgi:D-alanyl-D-alanine carboxypeptidase